MITTDEIAEVQEEEFFDGSHVYNVLLMTTSPMTATTHCTKLAMRTYTEARKVADIINDYVLDIETW